MISAKVKVREVTLGGQPSVKVNELSFWREPKGAHDSNEILRVDYDLDDFEADARGVARLLFDGLMPLAENGWKLGRIVNDAANGRISLFEQDGDGEAGGLWDRHGYPPVGFYRRETDDADLVIFAEIWKSFRVSESCPDAPPCRFVGLGRYRRDQLRRAFLAFASICIGEEAKQARDAADVLFFMIEARDGETVLARLTHEQLATVNGALRDFISRAPNWPADVPWPKGVARPDPRGKDAAA